MKIGMTTYALALLAVTGLGASASAQFPATETAQLEPELGQFAGASVALHGDVAFVSAPGDLTIGSSRFVHAYRRNAGQWVLEQSLASPDPHTRFGFALDFDGTTLVVGSPLLPSGTTHGRADTYTWSGAAWVGAELPPPPVFDPVTGFGNCVAVDGELVLVGAPLTDVPVGPGQNGTNVGAAYAYRSDGAGAWKLKQQVAPSPPIHDLAFGAALDISGHDAIVGAGSSQPAYAFHFANGTLWSQTQVLVPSQVTPTNGFGQAVSLAGDRAVIGAWQDMTFFPDQGAVFVFERTCDHQWVETQRINAPPGAAGYGHSVGIHGQAVIIGAEGEDAPGANMAGAAYAYRWDGVSFGLEQHLQVAVPEENDQLGGSLAMDGDRALIGAKGASPLAGGSAFVFDAAPVASPWTDLGHALAGASEPRLHGTGTLQAASPLTLAVECGPAGAMGALFIGLGEINAPFKGGVLVPLPLVSATLLLDGSGGLVLATSWPALPPGTTIALQAWVVDAGGPAGVSASNGLRATAMP